MNPSGTGEQAYILGTDADELQRLRFQHQAWAQQATALFERAGLRAGQQVLDLGCGPGYTSLELAQMVGPSGKVIARDRSARFLSFLRAECERLSLAQIEPSEGEVEDLVLEDGCLDAAYARWLLCWLPEPGVVLQRAARWLKPGGALMLQDYLDWGAMKLVPRDPAFDRAVAACLQSFAEGGGSIDVGEHIPVLAERAGLRVEQFRPVARLGRPGSMEWGWLGGFFAGYLPKLVQRGLLDAADHAAWQQAWDHRTASGLGFVYTPTVVDVVLRRP